MEVQEYESRTDNRANLTNDKTKDDKNNVPEKEDTYTEEELLQIDSLT